jgi:hypothetical protein
MKPSLDWIFPALLLAGLGALMLVIGPPVKYSPPAAPVVPSPTPKRHQAPDTLLA